MNRDSDCNFIVKVDINSYSLLWLMVSYLCSAILLQDILFIHGGAKCQPILIFAGAGKTTTFNILIGDTAPTSGTAIISGFNIRTDLRKVYT